MSATLSWIFATSSGDGTLNASTFRGARSLTPTINQPPPAFPIPTAYSAISLREGTAGLNSIASFSSSARRARRSFSLHPRSRAPFYCALRGIEKVRADPERFRVFRVRGGISRDISGSPKTAETRAPPVFPQPLRDGARDPFLRFPSWTSPVRPRSPALSEASEQSGAFVFFARRFLTIARASSGLVSVLVWR